MYYQKIHEKDGNVLLAVCDKKAHNKKFEDEQLQLFVDPDFYGRERVDEEELVELFNRADIINLVGKKCIDLAIRLGLVEPENILDIGGCSHTQVLRI
jgi:hypothetical protein